MVTPEQENDRLWLASCLAEYRVSGGRQPFGTMDAFPHPIDVTAADKIIERLATSAAADAKRLLREHGLLP